MAAFTASSVTLKALAARPAGVAARRSVKVQASQTNLKTAIEGGMYGAIAPFEDGLDPFGFSNTDEMTLKRYREAELAHGRVSMLAALGFLVGEQVEGSSFLFDSQVTGPAIDHFQQVPEKFWIGLLAFIAICETTRVQRGWAAPGASDKLFQLKDDYTPGDLDFDPLKLKPTDEAKLLDYKIKELNNGRLAMISISGMVAQELVNGINILPADEVLEMGKAGALVAMEKECAGAINEAECAKAFEAALAVAEKALN